MEKEKTEVLFRMVVGLPHSGKSTYAEKLAENTKDSWVVRYDAYEKSIKSLADESVTMNEDYYEVLRKYTLQKMVDQSIILLSHGLDVIFDADCVSQKERYEVLESIKKSTDLCNVNLMTRVIIMVTPYEECIENERLSETYAGRSVDEMIRKYQVPSYIEGWDWVNIHRYEGCKFRTLEEILEETDKVILNSMNHKNEPLHDHLCNATGRFLDAYMKKYAVGSFKDTLTGADILTALSIHDIGKIYTTEIVKTLAPGETDYHAFIGGYVSLEIMSEMFNVSQSTNQSITTRIIDISILIQNHMDKVPKSYMEFVKVMPERSKFINSDMHRRIVEVQECDKYRAPEVVKKASKSKQVELCFTDRLKLKLKRKIKSVIAFMF